MPRMLREIPCLIVATAALLAGSEMASRKYVPEGSEWGEDMTRVWEGDGMVGCGRGGRSDGRRGWEWVGEWAWKEEEEVWDRC